MPGDLHVHRQLVIPDHELNWRFSRSSGPGGQGVNTTDSRVELSYDVQGSPALTDVHRARALERLGSEEHTSEVQSRQYLVCRLLLEKKKRIRIKCTEWKQPRQLPVQKHGNQEY